MGLIGCSFWVQVHVESAVNDGRYWSLLEIALHDAAVMGCFQAYDGVKDGLVGSDELFQRELLLLERLELLVREVATDHGEGVDVSHQVLEGLLDRL